MRPNKTSNVITYILGMGFNLALMAVVGYAIYHFALRGFAFGGDFAYDMLATGPNEEVTFVLEEDTPRAVVARRLYYYEIIPNPWLFRLEMFLKNSTRVFRAGTYTLNRNMTNTEVNATLRRGEVVHAEHLRITIREGWRIRDMAQYFEYREFFTAEEFIEYTQYGDFSNFRFLDNVPNLSGRNRLEGYLFPETYFIPLNPTPRQIISRMLNQFEYVMESSWLQRAYDLGFTLDEIITMASIIEAETRLADERATVSQVIHNRLRIGMDLQMCSTVSYFMDIRRDRLTNADTRMPSPYNTYLNSGLPIGPIGNPGLASIEAALWPTSGPYLFFVLQDVASGQHFFSTNFGDHSAAASRYNQPILQTE